MKLVKYEMSRPLKFIQSGRFSSQKPWQHSSSTRKKDTEILIGLKGKLPVAVDDKKYSIAPGEVLSVYPGETIVGTEKTQAAVDFIWLHFVNQAPLNELTTYPTKFEQASALILPRYFKITDTNRLLTLAIQMLDATHSDSTDLVASDYFVSYFVSVLSNDYLQNIHQDNYEEGIVNKIKEWIRANIDSELNINEIALHFNLNHDYMARLFKHVTGITMKNYINQLKIYHARYLLLTTNLSVEEVAKQSYFNDYKYFFRLFKQYTNLTPLKYRNAFTNTFLNNSHVDEGYDVGKIVSLLEKGLDGSTIY